MLLGRAAKGPFLISTHLSIAPTADVLTTACGLLRILRVTLHMVAHPLHPCLHTIPDTHTLDIHIHATKLYFPRLAGQKELSSGN